MTITVDIDGNTSEKVTCSSKCFDAVLAHWRDQVNSGKYKSIGYITNPSELPYEDPWE